VKSRLSLRAQRQMSGAPGGDAPLLSCTRDEGISLEFGTKPGGGSPLHTCQRTSASKVPLLALRLWISEATGRRGWVPVPSFSGAVAGRSLRCTGVCKAACRDGNGRTGCDRPVYRMRQEHYGAVATIDRMRQPPVGSCFVLPMLSVRNGLPLLCAVERSLVTR